MKEHSRSKFLRLKGKAALLLLLFLYPSMGYGYFKEFLRTLMKIRSRKSWNFWNIWDIKFRQKK